MQYEIVDIDYYENDAILKLGDARLYFQFSKKPNLKSALKYLFMHKQIAFFNEPLEGENWGTSMVPKEILENLS